MAAVLSDFGHVLTPEQEDAALTPLVVRRVDERVVLVHRNGISRYVRGESRTLLFQFAATAPRRRHTWDEVRAAWAAQAGHVEDDPSTWRAAPERSTLLRYGNRIRKELVELGPYWSQGAWGVCWAPPGTVAAPVW
jgi:hypothetical protein